MVTHEKILGFAGYVDGWNYGEGVAIDRNLLIRALLLVEVFDRCGFETDAFPYNDGGVEVHVYGGKFYAAICLHPRREIEIEIRSIVPDSVLGAITAERLAL